MYGIAHSMAMLFETLRLICNRNIIKVFYRPQRSWAKVMFLQASGILSTEGGGFLKLFGGSPNFHQSPPDTVNERPVRILLECILVCYILSHIMLYFYVILLHILLHISVNVCYRREIEQFQSDDREHICTKNNRHL